MNKLNSSNMRLSLKNVLFFAAILLYLSNQNISGATYSFDTARIYHAMAKARRGDTINIVVFGGSITAGSLASTESKRWANIMTDWWINKFPDAKINLINSGIGGTGSDIGTFRTKGNVLRYKPDFVVVEFSVNDAGEDDIYAQEMMEGVIRQLLQDSTYTGIMMLLLKMENGGTAQVSHKKVGKYYGIPMVSQADLIDAAVAADGHTLSQVFGDNNNGANTNGIHPNDLGMQYIAKFLTNELDSIYAHLPDDIDLPPKNTNVPDPLITDVFSKTFTYYYKSIVPSTNNGFSVIPDWHTSTPGSEITFSVYGNAIAINYSRHNSTDRGKIEVWVDDKPHKILDAYWDQTWGPAQVFCLIENNLPDGEHILHFKSISDITPPSTGNYFQVQYIYKAGNIGSAAPIADAGGHSKILLGNDAELNGIASFDPDNDPIVKYKWSVFSRPNGSSSVINNDSISITSYTPDVAGYYKIGLVVNDGNLNSIMNYKTINVKASNTIPVANAGNDSVVQTYKTLRLSGTRSKDADGDSLMYLWEIISQPAGSNVKLYKNNLNYIPITPKIEGQYVFGLIVNDSLASSFEDTVEITALTTVGIQNYKREVSDFEIFPNPTDNLFTISYLLQQKSHVVISIYSNDGRKIKELFSEKQPQGKYQKTISVREYRLQTGVYFIRIQVNEFSSTKRIMIN